MSELLRVRRLGLVMLAACTPALAPIEAEVIDVPAKTCERWFRFADEVPEDVRETAELVAASVRGFAPRARIAFGPEGKDQFLVALEGSDAAARIDFLYGSASRKVDGLTTTFDDGSPAGRVRVVVLPQRVGRGKLWRVIAHELLHACGLSDVEEEGNVMTGEEPRNAPPVNEFGPADSREARKKGL